MHEQMVWATGDRPVSQDKNIFCSFLRGAFSFVTIRNAN